MPDQDIAQFAKNILKLQITNDGVTRDAGEYIAWRLKQHAEYVGNDYIDQAGPDDARVKLLKSQLPNSFPDDETREAERQQDISFANRLAAQLPAALKAASELKPGEKLKPEQVNAIREGASLLSTRLDYVELLNHTEIEGVENRLVNQLHRLSGFLPGKEYSNRTNNIKGRDAKARAKSLLKDKVTLNVPGSDEPVAYSLKTYVNYRLNQLINYTRNEMEPNAPDARETLEGLAFAKRMPQMFVDAIEKVGYMQEDRAIDSDTFTTLKGGAEILADAIMLAKATQEKGKPPAITNSEVQFSRKLNALIAALEPQVARLQ
jgi:hypothetical protein